MRNALKRIILPNPRILLVSLQKSGTHLVSKVLQEAGLKQASRRGTNGPVRLKDFYFIRKGSFLLSHYSPADDMQMALEEDPRSTKIIFNFRDPRDVLVSWFHWMHPKNNRPMHSHMRYMQKVYSHFTDQELISVFINNDKFRAAEYNPLEHFRLSRVLLYHPAVLNVRFEDLIGPNGGGSQAKQVDTIRGLFQYLNVNHCDPERVANSIFSKKSPTFRKGQVGGFKELLSPSQLREFDKLHGEILQQYGYS